MTRQFLELVCKESMDQNEIQSLKSRIHKLEQEIHDIKGSIALWENDPNTPKKNILTATKSSLQERISNKISQKIPKPKKTWEDWEFLLGGNWMAKIGIVAILLAMAWFLDLAFSKDWVTDSGKIYIGLLFGLGFVGGSNYFAKRKFLILTPAILGAGFSILYLSIFSAYRFYSYLGIEETFIYLSLLSILVIALSEYTKNEIIFLFGYIGSLFSPVLLSTGENSYRFLFIYLFINLLLFAWASRGLNWRWAPLMVFFSNWFVFDVWMFENIEKSSVFISIIFLFTLVGFFFVRELILESESNRINPFWISKVVVVGSLLIFVGNFYYILDVHASGWENISFLVGSFISIGFSYQLKDIDYKDWKVPTLFYLTIGLLYFSLIQQVDRSLLTFTLLVFAFLFSYLNLNHLNQYISQRDSNSLIIEKNTISNFVSYLLWAIALIRLFFVESDIHYSSTMFWNVRFGIYLFGFVGLFYLYFYSKRNGLDGFQKNFFALGSLVVILVAFLMEVHFGIYDSSIRNQGYNIVFGLFAFFFLLYGFTKSEPNYRKLGIGFLLFVILKFALYDIWLLSLIVKILAGFIMGILLIVLGLFYEKLKTKIIGEIK